MGTSEDAVSAAKGRKRTLPWDEVFDKHARVGVQMCAAIGEDMDSTAAIGRGTRAELAERVVTPQQNAHKEGRLQSSDTVCNILSFMPFSQRWSCRLLSRSFYQAFHTKYAWDHIDVRFLDVDIFKFNFLNTFHKHFVNTLSLFLSIHENTRAEPTINLAFKNFPRLTDLRLYCRKKNNNYIFEGVHPMVSSLLSGKATMPQKEDVSNDTHEHADDSAHGMTSPLDSAANQCSQSPVDLSDWDFEFSDLFLYNRYYGHGQADSQNGRYNHGQEDGEGIAHEVDDPPDNLHAIAARSHIWKQQRLHLANQFEHLERLVLDVKVRGDELLPFVGKMTNLKDIILSKLLYTDKLNRAQCITIFTCFIEQIKKNNIRVLQLGLFFTREYKPTDYLDNELFRKLVKGRTQLTSNADKEEGDDLIHVLHKNHLHSLYCLWSNDLFISFDMYERIRTFSNLKVWILPGWRALSLVKQ
ncbi:hypothetical protein AK88_03390 [Plasmodium fragile]|uniref:F-box domain-containing protein n=1 Tax=Plasmodium fragile TaxID=5857 RepID=A0A0D9QMN6_PLAFR|nr:uncharacterized protein AK88_03390 [Plasmodium fragile]KJP86991.1 hypothetical protein AK88_03390 [Plasmodium fragile]